MQIKELSANNINEAIEIANTCFGKGFINDNVLNAYLKLDNKSFVIIDNKKTIGFCLLKIETRNLIHPHFKPYTTPNKKIGIVQTIAIHPNFQMKGLGSYLLEHSLTYLKAKHCYSALYPAWIENSKDYFLKKIENIGFETIKTFNNFWFQESIAENYTCLKCGLPPCKCSLKLYKVTF